MSQNIKCILVYGIEENIITKIKQRYGKVIKLTNNMANIKIKDIIEGNDILLGEQEVPDEQMVVFNGFSEGELKGAIKYIRSFVNGGVLAVTTPTSSNWSFKYLLEHLIEEREWFKMQQKGRE
ncbi:DUF3783 domain-containing protein [Clostridium weizhouense]|uniref:DUF3783 domain-containing protein n=1 Tax=Clostridium weizhouense TaxID=2859781 RepID=A0ABS7ASL7_9CLOT|nr:DUF3783 domain-containing protein [Clostridium weizhouense]MBW6411073.1 DUF3783 domain-containing protein [Clostridium weizhouense]